jgi:NhaP-type Na+/H+ or K+/H+ antiporter
LDYSTKDDGSFSDDNYDDYFEEFSEHVCCSALMAHHSDYCEENSMLSNFHLFVASFVLLLCECAKAVVQHYQIKFLPEAATCILVGTLVGAILSHLPVLPGNSLDDDLSFDDELFLTLLLPPIIFEAALSVSKKEFKRRRGAIFMFSVVGTIVSTFSTGIMVHYSSKFLSHVTTFPMLDSLVFGALISSIDPVAILSVLTSLNLNQKDTIFILVFGESLLNDGIAITVFQTLVARFDGKTNDGSTSMDEIYDAAATFLISMFGSIAVGLLCGCAALLYFVVLRKQLAPVMEVGSFFLWAVIPYYICDGVGWSGIVSIVAVAFFMDIYIAGPKLQKRSGGQAGQRSNSIPLTSQDSESQSEHADINTTPIRKGNGRGGRGNDGGGGAGISAVMTPVTVGTPTGGYVHMNEDGSSGSEGPGGAIVVVNKTPVQAHESERSIGPLPSTERITLSPTADKHVRFVAHLTSQLAENAIFAYLGLFLFSSNYDWNLTMMTIAIVSCVLSRAFMVFLVSRIILQLYKCRNMSGHPTSSRTAAAIRDKRTQTVLVLAGLRGAVSLALVENVPIYNSMTGEGCEFKPLMKGMTSAAILFTTFIFGGGAFYILPHLGISPEPKPISPHFFKGGGSTLS